MSQPASAHVCRTIGQTLEHAQVAGTAQEKLDGLLADLANHILDHGGKAKGSLTIKLDFEAGRDGVETRGRVTVKTPEEPAVRSFGWLTADNRLTRRNPAQPDLPFQDVSAPRGDVIDAD